MDVSPFPYQGPLQPAEVSGRDELLADLVERVTTRRVTALLGPRRYGKTSLLRKLEAELAEVVTMCVDLYEVTSMADLAARLDDGLSASKGPFAKAARDVAATLSINLGVVGVTFTGPARERPGPASMVHALLKVLVDASLRSPTLLVVDEFGSIARVAGAAGALRTAVQGHYRDKRERGTRIEGRSPPAARQATGPCQPRHLLLAERDFSIGASSGQGQLRLLKEIRNAQGILHGGFQRLDVIGVR